MYVPHHSLVHARARPTSVPSSGLEGAWRRGARRLEVIPSRIASTITSSMVSCSRISTASHRARASTVGPLHVPQRETVAREERWGMIQCERSVNPNAVPPAAVRVNEHGRRDHSGHAWPSGNGATCLVLPALHTWPCAHCGSSGPRSARHRAEDRAGRADLAAGTGRRHLSSIAPPAWVRAHPCAGRTNQAHPAEHARQTACRGARRPSQRALRPHSDMHVPASRSGDARCRLRGGSLAGCEAGAETWEAHLPGVWWW